MQSYTLPIFPVCPRFVADVQHYSSFGDRSFFFSVAFLLTLITSQFLEARIKSYRDMKL